MSNSLNWEVTLESRYESLVRKKTKRAINNKPLTVSYLQMVLSFTRIFKVLESVGYGSVVGRE